MGSESQNKMQSNFKRRQKAFVCFAALCIIFLLFSSSYRDPTDAAKHGVFKKASQAPKEITALELKPYQNCSSAVPTIPEGSESSATKPIFFSMPPFQVSELVEKNLINKLTGTSHGSKSFYAKKGGQRHCQGGSQTFTCINVESGTAMERRASQFHNKYILALRNPMTYLPSYTNAKAAKYHNQVGQMEEVVWKDTRKKFWDDMIDTWKQHVLTWHESKAYNVGMYFVYEDLYDMDKGPILMKTLRLLLLEAGFTNVALEEDLSCIWYNSVGEENLRRFRKLRYDYDDYIPAYTVAEKDSLLLKTLQDVKDKVADDARLVEIMESYLKDIETHIRIED